MSKHVLILGAGLVSQPLIDYLYEETDHTLGVADILEENARKAVGENARGTAHHLDVNDESLMIDLISRSDLVVSLLPYTLHGVVAQHCLREGKHMVNASYVSDEMRSFHKAAKEKDLVFLCETGLDPGIDHMSAMQIIEDVQGRGGKVTEFVSVCGGLPAPEANTNPFGYKFSWSPKGVLLAGNNDAHYIKDGGHQSIPAVDLFRSTKPMTIDSREFEAYPNRDSVSYEEIYGLEGIQHLMRGTLRYAGWHRLILAIKALELTSDTSLKPDTSSYAQMLADLHGWDTQSLRPSVCEFLELGSDDPVIEALAWLGLFDTQAVELPESPVIDVLAELMNSRMSYDRGERDMVVLQHLFEADFEDHVEKITSTLFDYGVPFGASSMARTVSLPLAIAVKLILAGKISSRGVCIPVSREFYEPILKELQRFGIAFKEESKHYAK